MKPRISIVTPYLDAAAFLQDAIDSVRAQTISEWELLLVDDGSSDAGPAIARAAASQDSRIRIVASAVGDAKGAAAARNRGLREARADFVAFLDADDMFTADKLGTELAIMDSHPEAMMVCGASLWWYPEDEGRNWIDKTRWAQGLYRAPELLNRIILLRQDEVPCTCAVLIRRRAIEALGGFEETLRLYEDQSLWVKIMWNYPVFVGRHLTSVYRQNQHSTSAAAQDAGEYDRLRIHSGRGPFLAWVRDYLASSGRREATTDRALRIATAVASGDRSDLSVPDGMRLIMYMGQSLLRRLLVLARSRLRNIRQTPAPLTVAAVRRYRYPPARPLPFGVVDDMDG
jgi:glycosyltransferase involved in cell wall biosynthesis